MFFQEDFYSKILLILIALCLFLSIILILKPNKRSAVAYLLGILFSLHAFELYSYYLLQTGYLIFHPKIAVLNSLLRFIIGPVIYFLIKIIKNKNWNFGKIQLLHFLPFLLAFFMNRELFFTQENELLTYLINSTINYREGISILENLTLWQLVRYFIFRLQPFVYLIISLVIIFKPENTSSLNFYQKISFKVFISFYTFVYLFGIILQLTLSAEYFDKLHIITASLMGVIFVVISIVVYLYPNLVDHEEVKKKYVNSKLNDKNSQKYKSLVDSFFNSNEIIFEQNVTLQMISEKLDISSRELSQIINEHFGMNFKEFLNNYRIDKAKKMLLSKDSELYTIEAIAEKVGFNTRASFYRAFKNKFGITPTDYKKSQNIV